MMHVRAMVLAAAAGTMLVAGGAGQPEKQPNKQPGQPDRTPGNRPPERRLDDRMRNEPMTMNFDKDTAGSLPPGWHVATTRGRTDPGRPGGIEPRKPGEPDLPGGPGPDKPGAPEEKPTTPQKPGEQPPARPADPARPGGERPMTTERSAGWAVTADPTAPSAPNILQLSHPARQINGYNLITCDHHNGTDVDLSAKMRADTGAANQGGGLAWRVRDAENFYACSYNPADGKLRAFRVSNGRSTEIGSADFKGSGPDASTWYTLGARMNGDSITCSINGQELLNTKDMGIKDSGKIGLWSRGDASSSFDDVTVNKVSGANPDRPDKDIKPMPKPGDKNEPPKSDG